MLRADGPAHLLAKYFFHDGSHVSRIVYSTVIGTLPNQAQGLNCLLKAFRLIVVEAFMPLSDVEVLQAGEQGRARSESGITLKLSCIIVTPGSPSRARITRSK